MGNFIFASSTEIFVMFVGSVSVLGRILPGDFAAALVAGFLPFSGCFFAAGFALLDVLSAAAISKQC